MSTIQELKKIRIEDIQNVSIFIISISSFCSYLYYNLSSIDGTKPFHILYPIVFLHALIDFFITKSYDLKLHHIFIFGIVFYNYYYSVTSEYRFIFLYPLLKTEISSIFYVLKYWLPKNTIIFNVNMILFYLSFYKFRIFDFYKEIIHNNSAFDIVFQKYSKSNIFLSSIFLLSCYGLYILNLYWFLIMNKILYKSFVKIINIDTDVICHFLCCYTHWINIPLSCYIYSQSPNEKHIFDIIGITILSISSYNYHYDIYNRLYHKQIEEYFIPNKDNIVYFLNDSISINVRIFLIIATNYFHSQLLLPVLLISGIFHMVSVYHCNLNILELFIDHDKKKDEFLINHNINLAIPIACGVFFIFLNSPIEISIPFLFVNILIGLLFVVKPFYKLTHVAFHLLLIAQNFYLCLSSIS